MLPSEIVPSKPNVSANVLNNGSINAGASVISGLIAILGANVFTTSQDPQHALNGFVAFCITATFSAVNAGLAWDSLSNNE